MTKQVGPLEGIRVVEFGRFVTAPYTARLLGDMGADVIKLEGPDGDPFRTFSGELEQSPHFKALNRNKRSIAVDMSLPEGRELMRHLMLSADVVLENTRPGSMERLGLGYEDLRSLNPKLIYCSITGMGDSGPYRSRPAYDMVGQALSGLAHTSMDPHTLTVTGTNTSDSVTGLTAATAILAAIVSRSVRGSGQHVEINMLSSSLSFLGAEAQILLDTGVAPGPLTRPANSLSFAVRCGDGLPLGLHISSVEKFWVGLTDTIGRPDLREDPRFLSRAHRSANHEVLSHILQDEFSARPRAHWLEELVRRDVPAAPINTLAEAVEDPQVQHLDVIQTMVHPALGASRTVGAPHTFGEYPVAPMVAPPRLGEHSMEILAELDLTTSDRTRLEPALRQPVEVG